jgi:HPt (histidine-containing phosphotransfer) domain-containing protein
LVEDEAKAALAALWVQYRPTIMARVVAVEQAVMAAQGGALSDELREKAHGEAHKLAGSMGTFGFAEASELAHEAEDMLDPEVALALDPVAVARLSELVATIRQQLERGTD